MKKQLLFIVIFLSAFRSFGQITLDQTFNGNLSVVLFSSNGEKYMYNDTASIYLYNMDYSLWKTITPTHYAGYTIQTITSVSDNLFNSDNLVEAVVTYVATVSTLHPNLKCDLVNETAAVLYSFDSSYFSSVHYDDATSNYKVITFNYLTHPGSSKVYSVPGTMPCGSCSYLGTQRLSGTKTGVNISDPIPNPSSGVVRINYNLPDGTNGAVISFYNTLGQVVKIIPVLSQINAIEINNSTLPAGSYMYNIKAENTISETKTMVIR